MKLLSIGSNPKTHKSDMAGLGYLTAILHLAPASLSGQNVCPSSSAGCRAACLNKAGLGGVYPSIQKARIAKTQWFYADQQAFMAQLVREIRAFTKRCAKLGVKPAVRLNGTSDILWEKAFYQGSTENIMGLFPEVQFYDYTKIAARMLPGWKLPANYSLTFSHTESNHEKAAAVLASGGNVAVVFRKALPLSFNGHAVINGDATDLRFLDRKAMVRGKGIIVGLTAKGPAKKDQSGFVFEAAVA